MCRAVQNLHSTGGEFRLISFNECALLFHDVYSGRLCRVCVAEGRGKREVYGNSLGFLFNCAGHIKQLKKQDH